MQNSIPVFTKLFIDVNENVKTIDKTYKKDISYLKTKIFRDNSLINHFIKQQLIDYSTELDYYRKNLEEIKNSLNNFK